MKYLFLSIAVFFHFTAISQNVELKSGGFDIKLKRVDTLFYSEYPKTNSLLTDSSVSKIYKTFLSKYSYGIVSNIKDKKINIKYRFRTNFYVYEDGTLQAPTTQLFFKPKNIELFIKKFGSLGKIEVHPTLKGFYYFYISDKKFQNGESIFKLCTELYNQGEVSLVEPIFIKYLNLLNPLRPKQWGIKNVAQVTGATVGSDMGIEKAWDIASGAGIKIAVIDDGVDLTHPDLQNNLLPGFDATGNNSGGAPVYGNVHGTSCAGIIAAADNLIGPIGIAYKAKIIPIRMGITSNNVFTTNDNWITNCFAQAQARGADIISNSWGGGSPSAQINAAIQDAVGNGRGGKGCIVLFAAGNNNAAVQYPATNIDVIAVGASTPCDTRKRSSNIQGQLNPGVVIDSEGVSCDGEVWWGSNFGVNLDVLAPGVFIPTTDDVGLHRTGDPGDYNELFNGTSAACPNAAGVAALILSANPNLTGKQARDILEQTCFKIPSANFQANINGQPNGTWSTQAGYGRINADLAVCQASKLCGPFSFSQPNTYSYFAMTNLVTPRGSEVAYLKNGQVVVRIEETENVLAPLAPLARPNSPLIAGGIPGELHYYYIGMDDNIHDVYKRTVAEGWVSGNLNPSAKCKPNSNLAADYANWSVNGNSTLPFVFYVNNDNYVCCLEYINNNWINTVFNFGTTIKDGSPMTMITQDNAPFLMYIGDDDMIHGYSKFPNWVATFPDPHSVKCRSNSPLVSGKYEIAGNLEDSHGFYVGVDNKIYTVWTQKYLGGNWRTDCLDQTTFVSDSSKFYFIRHRNTAASKLMYQGRDNNLYHISIAPNQPWRSVQINLPTNLKPDPGTPLAYFPFLAYYMAYYKTNGNLVRVQF